MDHPSAYCIGCKRHRSVSLALVIGLLSLCPLQGGVGFAVDAKAELALVVILRAVAAFGRIGESALGRKVRNTL